VSLWLDVARVGAVLAMAALVLHLVLSVIDYWRRKR